MSTTITTVPSRLSVVRLIAQGSKSGIGLRGWSNDRTNRKRRSLHLMPYHSYNYNIGNSFGHNSTKNTKAFRSIKDQIRWDTLQEPKYFSTVPDFQQTQQQQQQQQQQQHQEQPSVYPSTAPVYELSLLAEKEDGEDGLYQTDHTIRWTVPHLDSLAEAIRRNVSNLLSGERLDDSDSVQCLRTDRSLHDRWNATYRKEKENYRRRMMGSQTKSAGPRKKTIDELWDDSLQSIRISRRTAIDTETVDIPSIPLHFGFGDEDYDEEKHDGIGVPTPLFGLAVDENFHVLDLDRFLGRENEIFTQPTTALKGIEAGVIDDDMIPPKSHPHPDSWNQSNNDDGCKSERDYHDAILHAIALLRASRPNDWVRFGSSRSYFQSPACERGERETVSDLNTASELSPLDDLKMKESAKKNALYDTSFLVSRFLEEVADRKHATSTLEANLCLAHLITCTSMDADAMMEWCLQIFNEMLVVADTGHHECQPDDTTYRLLILSLNRRFMAPGEAIKLCSSIMADETFSILAPEAFMEGMKACQAKMDLAAASKMMEIAFTKQRFRPPVDSCIVFVDMMKTQQLQDEALALFARLQQSRMLSPESENKLLLSMCHWPNRTRRGDFVDLAPFLLSILSIAEQKVMSSGERLGLPLWTKLVEGIYKVGKVDHSQMPNVAKAFRILLDTDRHCSLGRKLMWIGLETCKILGDSKLSAAILRQVADNTRIPRSTGGNDMRATEKNVFSQSTIIPHQAAKLALEICLKEGDEQSMEAISEILEQLYHSYSKSAQRELMLTILLCYARIGDSAKAKRTLETLDSRGMSPGEDVYAAVIHSLAMTNRHEEAESLFAVMKPAPGVKSFDAILLSRLRARSWDNAIQLQAQMKQKKILPSAQTIHGLLIANYQVGGQSAVVEVLNSLISLGDARLDEGAFRLTSNMLFREVDDNLEDFRQRVRKMGERDTELRQISLSLIRSLRMAEIESKRLPTPHQTEEEMIKVRDAAWSAATSHLLDIARATSRNDESKAQIVPEA